MAIDLLINYEIFVKALLIVIIVICSSFLGGTLNCDLHSILIKTVFRHLILYLVLFLVLDYTGDNTTAPTTLATNSLFIYGTFILLTKQTGVFIYGNILIILCIYIYFLSNKDLKIIAYKK